MPSLQEENARLIKELADLHQAVHDTNESRNKLVREIDVILNGEAGAAKQAMLCDVVSQLAAIARHFQLPISDMLPVPSPNKLVSFDDYPGRKLTHSERVLRRLIAFNLGKVSYHDDGEMQDSSEKPFIDFYRDSADQILEKLQKRWSKEETSTFTKIDSQVVPPKG